MPLSNSFQSRFNFSAEILTPKVGTFLGSNKTYSADIGCNLEQYGLMWEQCEALEEHLAGGQVGA